MTVKPLDLANIMRAAFLAGRGYKAGDTVSQEDVIAWAEYEPTVEELKAYERVHAALADQGAQKTASGTEYECPNFVQDPCGSARCANCGDRRGEGNHVVRPKP